MYRLIYHICRRHRGQHPWRNLSVETKLQIWSTLSKEEQRQLLSNHVGCDQKMGCELFYLWPGCSQTAQQTSQNCPKIVKKKIVNIVPRQEVIRQGWVAWVMARILTITPLAPSLTPPPPSLAGPLLWTNGSLQITTNTGSLLDHNRQYASYWKVFGIISFAGWN